MAYFGPASEVMNHCARLGLHCTMQYNPADYIRESPSTAHPIDMSMFQRLMRILTSDNQRTHIDLTSFLVLFCILYSATVEVVSDAASRKVLIGEDPLQESRPVKR